MPELFDFSDTSDLPPELQKQLSANRIALSVIMDAIKMAGRPVKAAEIRAAAYRMTGHLPSHSSITSAICRLKKAGKVQTAGHGLWEAV